MLEEEKTCREIESLFTSKSYLHDKNAVFKLCDFLRQYDYINNQILQHQGDPQIVELLLPYMEVNHFDQGQIVYQKGQRNSLVFFLLEGRINIWLVKSKEEIDVECNLIQQIRRLYSNLETEIALNKGSNDQSQFFLKTSSLHRQIAFLQKQLDNIQKDDQKLAGRFINEHGICSLKFDSTIKQKEVVGYQNILHHSRPNHTLITDTPCRFLTIQGDKFFKVFFRETQNEKFILNTLQKQFSNASLITLETIASWFISHYFQMNQEIISLQPFSLPKTSHSKNPSHESRSFQTHFSEEDEEEEQSESLEPSHQQQISTQRQSDDRHNSMNPILFYIVKVGSVMVKQIQEDLLPSLNICQLEEGSLIGLERMCPHNKEKRRYQVVCTSSRAQLLGIHKKEVEEITQSLSDPNFITLLQNFGIERRQFFLTRTKSIRESLNPNLTMLPQTNGTSSPFKQRKQLQRSNKLIKQLTQAHQQVYPAPDNGGEESLLAKSCRKQQSSNQLRIDPNMLKHTINLKSLVKNILTFRPTKIQQQKQQNIFQQHQKNKNYTNTVSSKQNIAHTLIDRSTLISPPHSTKQQKKSKPDGCISTIFEVANRNSEENGCTPIQNSPPAFPNFHGQASVFHNASLHSPILPKSIPSNYLFQMNEEDRSVLLNYEDCYQQSSLSRMNSQIEQGASLANNKQTNNDNKQLDGMRSTIQLKHATSTTQTKCDLSPVRHIPQSPSNQQKINIHTQPIIVEPIILTHSLDDQNQPSHCNHNMISTLKRIDSPRIVTKSSRVNKSNELSQVEQRRKEVEMKLEEDFELRNGVLIPKKMPTFLELREDFISSQIPYQECSNLIEKLQVVSSSNKKFLEISNKEYNQRLLQTTDEQKRIVKILKNQHSDNYIKDNLRKSSLSRRKDFSTLISQIEQIKLSSPQASRQLEYSNSPHLTLLFGPQQSDLEESSFLAEHQRKSSYLKAGKETHEKNHSQLFRNSQINRSSKDVTAPFNDTQKLQSPSATASQIPRQQNSQLSIQLLTQKELSSPKKLSSPKMFSSPIKAYSQNIGSSQNNIYTNEAFIYTSPSPKNTSKLQQKSCSRPISSKWNERPPHELIQNTFSLQSSYSQQQLQISLMPKFQPKLANKLTSRPKSSIGLKIPKQQATFIMNRHLKIKANYEINSPTSIFNYSQIKSPDPFPIAMRPLSRATSPKTCQQLS